MRIEGRAVRTPLRKLAAAAPLVVAVLALAACSRGPAVPTVRIPLGAGGVGFLPLYVMRDEHLIEKHARAAGITDLEVRWIDLGGPAVMNDALLSGSVDLIAAGPPAFLTLWDRTRGTAEVRGIAAMASLPMYLNTRAPGLRTLDDVGENDKIALTAVNVSIPALVMQMYARERFGDGEVHRFDKYTVSMTHPDAVVALLSGGGGIDAHFTSPPFHEREIENSAIHTVMSTDDVLGGPTTFTMLSTTAEWRRRNPELYRAVLAALEEAIAAIEADPDRAAGVLLAADAGAGFSREELAEVLREPEIRFTATPENVM
ncbi:MAG TPA: ABC transporter substrate-binding protein, partial [Gammaproteobacteria bacterium]|nr:ABC transporter substrate-binding protein [Gammaproteobacteria bacterium]